MGESWRKVKYGYSLKTALDAANYETIRHFASFSLPNISYYAQKTGNYEKEIKINVVIFINIV